jgi:NADP-reducing hydrogenase subunit HndC
MNRLKDLSISAEVSEMMNNPEHRWVAICRGTGCTSSASAELHQALQEELDLHDLNRQVEIRRTGCFGFCAQGPIMVVYPEETFYTQVKPGDAKTIVEEHILGGRRVERLMYRDPASNFIIEKWHDIGFYSKQQRILLSNSGIIDPENIDHYLVREGYQALRKALAEMTPKQVIDEVTLSGLRGRGGGGFPTGVKWGLARKTQQWPKYVICNADEGDPGAFMDRSVLEGDPHSVIEGMIIAGYAIGAQYGYIYCRAEYPLAIRRLEIALAQAREQGLLGENILGSGFSFDILIKEGAGAFVCGEETALMASIQGERGQPWPRPPYPAVSGLWEQPSNVNNVKSYAYVPRIIRLGAAWFKNLGTEGSPGTAVFALTGMVNQTGLIEVPMGITMREIIYDVGGGIPLGRNFKAVQTGGPLGGCLPEKHLDTPVDFDSLRAAGAVMGSGGMIVADETTCMVEFAKFFMKFVCDESCGKCPPCRIGSTRMLEILERITEGKGKPEDLDEIRFLARGMQNGSLCALGQLAPMPVLSTLRHFEGEYRAHIEEKRCPAGKCQAFMKRLFVHPELCTGCKICELACAVEHSRSKNLLGALMESPPPHPRLYVEAGGPSPSESSNMPVICYQCNPAPCITACIPQVMHRSSENGVTNVGGKRACIACSMCVMACPFGVIARAPAPDGKVMALKCDLCPGRDVPACVATCPTGAIVLMQGDEIVPTKIDIPAVTNESLAGLSAETIVNVLSQLNPDDVEPDPKAAVEKMVTVLKERREGLGTAEMQMGR